MKLVATRFDTTAPTHRRFGLNDDIEISQLLETAAEYATQAIDNVISQLEENDAKPNKLFSEMISDKE